MGKKAPEAPDYTAAAEASGKSSRDVTEQQTWANRPNQVTPFGSQTWSSTPTYDPTTKQTLNRWTQNTTLDPNSQHALDSQLQLQSGRSDLANSLFPRAQNEFGSAMSWGGMQDIQNSPDVPTYTPEGIQRNIGDTDSYDKQAGDAIYGQWADRAHPEQDRQRDRLRTQLYNSGLREGDQAYDAEMKKMEQNNSDAERMANYQATVGAGAEAQRMQGMDVTSGGFANSAAQQALMQQLGIGNAQFQQGSAAAGMNNTVRQQQIAEAMQRRGFSLNEINAVITGQQVGMPSMPGFNQATKSTGVDYSGAARDQYGAALDAANAKNAGFNSLFSGATSLGSSAMAFSDRRLKTNILRIGQDIRGFGYYVWDWIFGGSSAGVIADEVQEIPGAVVRDASGFDMVNYQVIYGS